MFSWSNKAIEPHLLTGSKSISKTYQDQISFSQLLCFGSPFLPPCECHAGILRKLIIPAASATINQGYLIEDPQGGRPPPHFYSRRFCRSVRRRTQFIRRRSNVRGNFAWGPYGGFLAGSWRILGGTSASSRLNFGKFSAESRQVLGGPKNFQRLPKRQPEGGQKAPRSSKRRQKGSQKASKGPPKPQKNESVFPTRFWKLKKK